VRAGIGRRRPGSAALETWDPCNQFPMKTPLSPCHPERTRISYFTALTSDHLCGSPKENHMQLTEVATLDRKSGGAEGSAVRHSGAPPLSSHLPHRPPNEASDFL
jgi:hypothetical protein